MKQAKDCVLTINGGIIGLILVAAFFDWAIIILSVLLGTEIIMTFLPSSASAYYWLVFLGLVVIGLVVQAGILHRRYPVRHRWARSQPSHAGNS